MNTSKSGRASLHWKIWHLRTEYNWNTFNKLFSNSLLLCLYTFGQGHKYFLAVFFCCFFGGKNNCETKPDVDDTFPKVEKVKTSQELGILSHFCVVLCQIARIFHLRNTFPLAYLMSGFIRPLILVP